MVKLLFSYSHKDEEFRDQLENHLSLLKRQEKILTWHDRKITAGQEIDKVIRDELETAQIILLLVSSNFLASNYCYENEMQRAIERHNNGTAVVIPVILHPCDWQSAPFGSLRATPTDGVPISKYQNQHEALAIVTKDIRQVVEEFVARNAEGHNRSNRPETKTQASNASLSDHAQIRRTFGDIERDRFLDGSFEFIAQFFDTSLRDLASFNSHIETQFKRASAVRFTATIYSQGQRISECTISSGSSIFRMAGIAYSNSVNTGENSFNEMLSVEDDGYTLYLRPLGMAMLGRSSDSKLTQKEAAEYYWQILTGKLK